MHELTRPEVFPVLGQSKGKQALPGCSWKSIFCECQPALPWMAAVPWPVLLQNPQSQRWGVKGGREDMLLCCKHKLQPKLAENHGFGASCPYSVLSALPSVLDHWLSLKKHLYPLMMSDSWSPTQPARERWADPW